MNFEAELELAGKTATGISVPPEVVASLNAGKRVPVVVTINKHSYRTTVAPYNGRYLIPVSAENRQAAGIKAGERINVGLTVDNAPREIEVPDDLAKALKKSKTASNFFASLSFSNQRGYVSWIEDAKKEETRTARVLKSIESLEAGKKVH
ncbi:MAG: YdeI/OmpD-associated family protein [Actinomycetota bacterium]|nr:YdeI/OmpD-associated family protein [Actinomycetota bacterium]